MSKVTPKSAAPSTAFATPFSSKQDEEKALRKHMEGVQAAQVHGIRTGDGPGETFIILEFPPLDDTPTDAHRPPPDSGFDPTQPVAITLADTMGNEFDWGHTGIQCRALAGAILSRVKANQGVGSVPTDLIDKFTANVIAKLDRHEWTLQFKTVERWCAANISTGVPET